MAVNADCRAKAEKASLRVRLREGASRLRVGLVPSWRRRKGVTLARAGVILAAYIAWMGQIALTYDAPAGENPWAFYMERTLWYGGPVLAYAFTAGLVVDHLCSRWGQPATFACYTAGIAVFMPVMLAVAFFDPEFVYEGGIQSFGIFLIWPLQIGGEAMLGYLLAWLIPDSFPHQYRILRAIGRFLHHPLSALRRHPLPTMRWTYDGSPRGDSRLPSCEDDTDWL
ncbi:MAG: hypothetical protein JW722_09010 [Demequinaceae bacterium]|nr:hypothetical protein [Demequinaceae bacterium]